MLFDANAYMESSGGASVLFDSNVNMLSSAGDQLLLDGSANLNSPGDVIFDGIKITGTGSVEASFTVGGQSVKLTPATADVGGATVNVQGQTLTSIKAPSIMIG